VDGRDDHRMGPPRVRDGFRALWTDAALYVRFDCADRRPWHTMTRRDDALWEEEVVEIFIDPTCAGRDYAEIEINPVNVVCDLHIHRPWPELSGDIGWRFEGLDTTVRHWRDGTGGERWTASAVLPWTGFASLCPGAAERVPPAAGDAWSFNVFRIKRPHGPAIPSVTHLRGLVRPEGPSFHAPAAFRPLRFAGFSPARCLPRERGERNDP